MQTLSEGSTLIKTSLQEHSSGVDDKQHALQLVSIFDLKKKKNKIVIQKRSH